jgi:glycerol-3-phosphate dehydrogenase
MLWHAQHGLPLTSLACDLCEYAAAPNRHEYCVTVEDFLARRIRLAFLDVAAAEAAVPRVSAT